MLGLLSAPFLLGGGGGAAKGLLPCFLVPKGDQPTACTLALWWLKFGPTRVLAGGGGGVGGSWMMMMGNHPTTSASWRNEGLHLFGLQVSR